jgi:hypothetical protein
MHEIDAMRASSQYVFTKLIENESAKEEMINFWASLKLGGKVPKT